MSTLQSPRQKAREMAFQFLYRFDQESGPDMSPAEIESDFRHHTRHFGDFEHSVEFALRLIQTTLKELSLVDRAIESVSQNWKFDRIGAVDKAFLRIGAAELLFFKDVPASVTLNEIIELSKAFGEEDTPLFLNGILDPISKLPEAVADKVPSDS
ncbi:transcription antitermination factor NusB [bacterium]|jgi:transcription antitermination factor NusB|nr:transcription antitermination factor NusB [bacterium]